MNSDITEQYLNKVYDDLSREQTCLLNKLKSVGDEEIKATEASITKQIGLINTLMLTTLKLKNARKQALKCNL